jgi:hypothetical protein
MIYIAWVGFYEGDGDRSYYDVLLPRIMEEIMIAEAIQQVTVATAPVVELGRHGREIDKVASEICLNKDQIHLLFIHADTGGRALQRSLAERSSAYCEAVQQRCAWDPVRCVVLTPRHETEAWVLSDPAAVVAALNYNGEPDRIGLPGDGAAAEALTDPKRVLNSATIAVIGQRRRQRESQLFTSIAQTQGLNALRGCSSFRAFETNLRYALASLGCLRSI